MGAGELEDALQTFSALIKSHPEFTEAWNKRATVYFLLGRHHLNPNPSPNPNPNPKPNPNPNPNPHPGTRMTGPRGPTSPAKSAPRSRWSGMTSP